MTQYNTIGCMAVSSSMVDDANNLAFILGQQELDGKSFHFALSSDGTHPATHYALCTVMRDEFVETFSNPSVTLNTIQWSSQKITRKQAEDVLFDLKVLFVPRTLRQTQDAVLSEFLDSHKLVPVQQEER